MGERGTARRSIALLAGFVSWMSVACQPASAPAPNASMDLITQLVFVPAGESQLPEFTGVFRALSKEALLVDRYEVRLAAFDPEAERPRDLPASCDWVAATAFAEASGMRLPTASEWMYVASGRLGHSYPWGRKRRSVANTLELGLTQPVSVGTFESGRGPFGTYDQIGNVWEWVADHVAGYEMTMGSEVVLPEGAHPGLRSVMGGSFRSRLRPLFPPGGGPPVFAMSLSVDHRANDIGFRRVANAGALLRAQLPSLDPSDAASRVQLVELSKAWFSNGEAQYVKLVETLAQEFRGRPGSRAVDALLEGIRP